MNIRPEMRILSVIDCNTTLYHLSSLDSNKVNLKALKWTQGQNCEIHKSQVKQWCYHKDFWSLVGISTNKKNQTERLRNLFNQFFLLIKRHLFKLKQYYNFPPKKVFIIIIITCIIITFVVGFQQG